MLIEDSQNDVLKGGYHRYQVEKSIDHFAEGLLVSYPGLHSSVW